MNRNLTNFNLVAILCVPCNSKVGRGNPFFSIGEKSPLSSVVFLRPSFSTILNGVRFIMTGLFGQPSRLVAPMRGISTPFSSVANDVEIIGFGNPFKHRIHQMKIAKPPAQFKQTQTPIKQKTTD